MKTPSKTTKLIVTTLGAASTALILPFFIFGVITGVLYLFGVQPTAHYIWGKDPFVCFFGAGLASVINYTCAASILIIGCPRSI